MRLFLQVQYAGTAYSGWQRQPAAPTVQAALEQALATLLRRPVAITAAGRTDAGVHATGQMVHLDLDAEAGEALGQQQLWQLNSMLPRDVAVPQVWQAATPTLHARYDATHRAYTYTLARTKPVFDGHTSWHMYSPLDLAAMQAASQHLLQEAEFQCFEKLGSNNATSRCHITHAQWAAEGPRWHFHIRADRFLRRMMRAIVDTLVEVGAGKHAPGFIPQLIASQDRSLAANAAPAKGLCLSEVGYPEGSLLPHCHLQR